MKNNIALIGFMGTGKSVVGKKLADKLGRALIEVDLVITEMDGKSIPEIFESEGEIRFRELEIEAIKNVAHRNNCIIACGGGVVLNKINIDRLKESSVIINLTASPEVISERTNVNQSDRPLLDVEDPAKRIRDLIEFRAPFYERAADFAIDTSNLDIDQVTDKIINRLKADEGFNLQQ